jgi:hypothetical protein
MIKEMNFFERLLLPAALAAGEPGKALGGRRGGRE